ncbi:uncharacterized protein METZ01_LOCUS370276, partial [marine metagenome]
MEEALENPATEIETEDTQKVDRSGSNFSYLFHRIGTMVEQNLIWATMLMVLLGVVLMDIIFSLFLFEPYVQLIETLSGSAPGEFAEVDIGFAPEVWQALLGIVLGTLILVISIASQSIPKLIDLYMRDVKSLLYVWLLIISGAHAGLIKLYGEINLMRESSRVFNTHFLIIICGIIAFPYIFYVLRLTKPTNIIEKIYGNNMDLIQSLTSPRSHAMVHIHSVVENQQYEMFEAFNQLDDILEFIDFKEVKADIIYYMSR